MDVPEFVAGPDVSLAVITRQSLQPFFPRCHLQGNGYISAADELAATQWNNHIWGVSAICQAQGLGIYYEVSACPSEALEIK